jgi:metal-responsive CopG/Arc/MetJ family transcriptional regulator
MPKAKIAITLDTATLDRVDRLVRQSHFASRSQAIQQAVKEELARLDRRRLTWECAKLDLAFEKALAEEGLSEKQTMAPAW